MATTPPIEIPVKITGVNALKNELKQVRNEIADNLAIIEDLTDSVEQFKDQLKTATDPEDIARINKELEETNAELEKATANNVKLSEQAGGVRDKLVQINEQAQVFASGSAFEKVGNNLGLIGSQLASLDFEGAGESALLLQKNLNNITPEEVKKQMDGLTKTFSILGKAGGQTIIGLIKNVGQMAKAFLSFGMSLLANPIFLIAAAIIAIVAIIGALLSKLGLLKPILNAIGKVFGWIGDAIDAVVQSIKDFLDWLGLTNFAEQEAAAAAADAQEKRADAYEKASKRIVKGIDQDIRMMKLEGEDTTKKELEKQYWIKKTAEERLKALRLRYKAMVMSGDYDDEEIKKLKESIEEQKEVIVDATNERKYIKKSAEVDARKEAEETRKKTVEAAKNEAKERAEAAKKWKADRLAVEREVQDITLALMKEGDEKERAQINLNYNRKLEDAKNNAKYTADELKKLTGLLEQQRTAELDAIDEKKRKEAADKEAQRLADLKKAAADEEAQLIEQTEAVQEELSNRQLGARQAELNAVQDKYFTLEEMARRHGQDLSEIEELKNAEIADINAKYDKEQEERDKAKKEQQITNAKGVADSLGALAEAFAGKSKAQQKKAFAVTKAANIANATIDTYKAATTAFASAPNPILGAIFAAGALAVGFKNIKTIAATKFDGGGGVSGGSSSGSPSGAGGGSNVANAAPTFSLYGQGNNFNNTSAPGSENANGSNTQVIEAVVVANEIEAKNEMAKKINSNLTLGG